MFIFDENESIEDLKTRLNNMSTSEFRLWLNGDWDLVPKAKCPCDDPDYKGVCDCLNGDSL